MKQPSVFRMSPRSSAWRSAMLSALALTAAVQWPLARPAAAQVPARAGATAAQTSPVASVNPFLGSAEHGHTYPGATVPFGAVQVSPDTPILDQWDGCSGYHYSQSTILGFSHSHLSGTGIGDLGDILLMPTVGAARTDQASYKSTFSHDQEQASPGYYSVFLQTPKVKAELSATAHCGIHRYTFPASTQSNIVLDLAHGIGASIVDTSVTVENNSMLSGTRVVNSWGGLRPVYFVMEFSKPFAKIALQQGNETLGEDAKKAGGKNVKAAVTFTTTTNEAILVRVGISQTSIEGARKNLAAELPNFDFDGTRAKAVSQWNTALGKVEIQTSDPAIRRTFYSNLYLSYLAPVLCNDADGSYRGADRQVHPNPGFQYYSTFSLWDTFRAEHPLLTLVQPQRVPDMVNSMVTHYSQFQDREGRHALPVWTLWGNEAWVMIGYHSAPVIVDAYLKGFKGFDPEAAYQALKDTATQDRDGLGQMTTYGYVTSGGRNQSVSRTLEYAYDDWCVGQMALKLGHTEDAEFFFRRAGAYRKLFDSRVGFIRGRKANGDWRKPFNPKQLVWADYTEANAWHYNWTVMQDIPGLINVTGGDAAFINKMEEMFNEKSDVIADIPDITGLIGQYAHGNEPVHHVAYLYNYAGAPYMTQRRVRQIMSTLYNPNADGQPGNNDCGQMSAWYVFSAMGFYPVNPAGGEYVIGSPAVSRATLHLDGAPYGSRTFTTIADNNSAQNVYIQSATLNGKALTRTYLTQAEIAAGGTLRLVMGPQPNLTWGKDAASRPASDMPKGYVYASLPTPSTNAPTVLTLPIRIIAGSDDPVQGFVPDENMTEGQTNNGNVTIDTNVPDAAPAQVYKSERYGRDFSFSLPVNKGKQYTVRLHFAEIFDEAPGTRIQNISINGKQVLTNFDIAAEAGQRKALVKTFKGISPNEQGNIVVRIASAPNSPDSNAKISGLEILAQ